MSDIDNLVELVKQAPKPKPDPRALNAYRHGLTGHVRFFASPEEEAAYTKHCEGYQACWAAVGAVEIDLCQRLADTSWRLNTVGQMENSIQAEALGHPVVRHCDHEQADIALEYSRIWKESGHQLDLLSRYERRLQRNYNELMNNLIALQDLRRAKEKENQPSAEKRQRWGLHNVPVKPVPPLRKFDFLEKPAGVSGTPPHP